MIFIEWWAVSTVIYGMYNLSDHRITLAVGEHVKGDNSDTIDSI